MPDDLRSLRNRAIPILRNAGGLRRSEIVCLDVHKDDIPDCAGWIKILKDGRPLTLRAKAGWHLVIIVGGPSDQTCPVHAMSRWLHFAILNFGPVFIRIVRDGRRALPARLSDKHVARLIKHTQLNAGIRANLMEKERLVLLSGHSLGAGLASSAEVDERHIRQHLGHASAEVTRRYKPRRDRFLVHLTEAVAL